MLISEDNEEVWARIAIVDDDAVQSDSLGNTLRVCGYNVVQFSSSRKFIGSLRHDTFDFVILDWLMPEYSGIMVLNHIREIQRDLPVLMLTCRTDDECIIEGLHAGADDYVVKPVRDDVLVAKVRALLRRIRPHEKILSPHFSLGPYTFDSNNCTVTYGNRSVALTNREFELARLFFTNPHRPLSRQYLMECLWGKASDGQTRTLDTHVARLRTKLELGAANGVKLNTLYAFGYRLESEQLPP